MDKGAHFYRSDFQVHSPRDRKWTGCKPVPHDQRMAFARAFVRACREAGLQAVGLTDHHDVCFAKYFQLAAQEDKTSSPAPTPSAQDPIIFPGAELTLAVPCQAIVLLDADADPSIQAMLLEAIGVGNTYPDGAADGPPVTPLDFRSLKDLDNALRRYSHGALKGRYIILPHVGDDGSHKTLLRKGFDPEYASMPCDGGYIECNWDSHKKQHILTGTAHGWGPRAIGVFQTSDSRREDCRDLGCRTTWVKMAEPTAEALRQACLARQSRISQVQPTIPATYISRIEVSASTFMGALDLELNPQFNAIIGGRGTGKSTILEYLRQAMQDQPVPYESDIEASDGAARKRRLIQETLDAVKGRVTVHWVLDQIPHVVQYDSGTKEITLRVADQDAVPATAEEVRHLLPIRAYSQKQLSSVSNRTAELQRFIEQPIQNELAQWQEQIDQHRRKIREVYSQILVRKQSARDLAAAKTELASLRERANAIEKGLPKLTDEASKAIKEHAARLREAQAQDAIQKDLDLAEQELSAAETALMELPQGLNLEEGSPQGELLRSIHQDAGELIARAINSVRDTRAVLVAGIGEILSRLNTWEANQEAHTRAYDAAQQEAATHKTQMAQLRDLREQEAEKQKQVTDLARDPKGQGDSEGEFARLLDSWIDLHRQRGNALERQCKGLTQMSDGEIKAELMRGADIDDALAKLRETLKGAYISQDRWDTLRGSLLKGGTAVEKWRALMLELRSLAETKAEDVAPDMVPTPLVCWDLTEKQRRAVLEKLQPDTWLEIALTSLRDTPEFLYKKAEHVIPFERASAGQQATALLKVLLSEEGGPLIIDQPEDDLDNVVIGDVVSLIWEAKRRRQIIFASHNANLVVNGDAELVVHCDYASEHDRSRGEIKKPGAIDVRAIRDAITQVMEGGEKAFMLRRQKYGF